MEKSIRILLVDDDEDEFILTQGLLSDRSYHTERTEPVGFELEWVETYHAALEEIDKQEHDIYLVDYQLGNHTGLELIQSAVSKGCREPFILMTGQGSYEVDIEAMRTGATDYLVKGEVTPALLERSIRYAIERKRAEEDIRNNAARSELLASLSHTFAEAGLSYPAVLNTIAHQIAESTGDACIICLLSEDTDWLDPVAFHHPDPDILASLQSMLATNPRRIETRLQDIQGVGTGSVSIVPEICSSPPEQPVFYHRLALPLQVKDREIGTLEILRSPSKPDFSFQEEFFFLDLAGRAALAIDNARLYDAVTQRAIELDALHKVTAELLSTIQLDLLLTRTLDIAQSAIPAADRALLHLAVSDTGELHLREASGNHDPRLKRIKFPKTLSSTAEDLYRRLPMLIPDLKAPLDLSGTCFAEAGLPEELRRSRSAVIAPLILGEELLGLISLVSSREGAFTEADRRLLMSFANTTTAALRNALLHSEVQRLAITDSLTEVFNRRGFDNFGRREVERALRFGRSLSAILVDIDNFKDINDTYGHAVGDQVLRIVADRLKASIREVDIVGRYGGDEFVLLLPETEPSEAAAAAERIRARLSDPIAIQISGGPTLKGRTAKGHPAITVTASLGIANITELPQDLSSLINRADVAAYTAKQHGRNQIVVG